MDEDKNNKGKKSVTGFALQSPGKIQGREDFRFNPA